ncbi:hypothetical protein A5886_002450 [Enterococcus sp. 8G7_MSG3316]|uniref:ROK family protein n=1 Tax=Candidatus Enterococcus testudinis TaxID=1834191 RepID=A0A242A8Y7_9ENTE|nr:ROK family transcriptional regulator [Enterococcus sp. 8G7_MSG3316]OTN77350.1 hypothetical protein A5886_002450 [Enterococcus sp. 8G7_MSG3316]
MKAYQPKNIKEHNQHLLLSILKEERVGMTTRQLAESSGLSVVTINKLLPELIENLWITPSEVRQKTGGRRAFAYQFNASRAFILVVQFIEKKQMIDFCFSIADLHGDIVFTIEKEIEDIQNFRKMLKELKRLYPKIHKTVIGIPGVEIVGKLEISDVPFLKGVTLREIIAAEIGADVVIENDVNAAAMHYRSGSSIVGVIYFPEQFPPGGALVIGQQLFTGANQMSGEIKYLPQFDKVSFPLKVGEILMQVNAAVQAMVAMYDPNKLILFIPDRWADSVVPQSVATHLASVYADLILPEIVVETAFVQACLSGLIQIGIEWPTIDY